MTKFFSDNGWPVADCIVLAAEILTESGISRSAVSGSLCSF